MALDIIISSKPKLAWSAKKSVAVAAISILIGLTIFIVAYFSMHKHELLYIYNQPILTWLVEHRKKMFTPAILVITSFAGSIYLSAISSAIAIIWAVIKREIWRPILFISSVGFCSVIATVVKSIAKNARPLTVNMVQPFETGYSFPSGHTIAITTFVLVLGYLIISRHSSDFRVTIWLIASVALIALIAFTRLYLGYHWLTDITASVGLGFIILGLVIIVDRLFIRLYKY